MEDHKILSGIEHDFKYPPQEIKLQDWIYLVEKRIKELEAKNKKIDAKQIIESQLD